MKLLLRCRTISFIGTVVVFLAFLSAGLRDASGQALSASIVGDLRPGTLGSEPRELTNVGGVLYFTADDGVHGRELWRSDLKTGETKMLVDLPSDAAGSSPGGLINFQGRLYFAATTLFFGRELWVHNPDDDTTERVIDTDSGRSAREPENLTAVGSFLFFTAEDISIGRELWYHRWSKKDLLVDLVRDITPGPTDPHGSTPPVNLTAVHNTLFFAANNSTEGYELWKADTTGVPFGTKPTAVQILDIAFGPTGSSPSDLVDFNGTLFFTVFDVSVAPGRRLWKSDGTLMGTTIASPSAIVNNTESGNRCSPGSSSSAQSNSMRRQPFI